MTAEIISVGTELLLGNIVNTNAPYLSRELAGLGIAVLRQSTIGDNPDRLAQWVNEAKQRADLLIFTGGLGPTADDLTKETVAACYGDTLQFDAEEWEKIQTFFARIQRPVTENNRKQAMVPVQGEKIPNANGTAPGAWFTDGEKQAILLPGVPREMQAMWQAQVRPRLAAAQSETLVSMTLGVFGGESAIAEKIGPLLEHENPTAAIYCKKGECRIRITARADSEAAGKAMCKAFARELYRILGDAVYDADVPGPAWTAVRLLQEKGMTVATAESCTGGMLAQWLTSVPGASQVFGFGYVTYWEQAKARMLGVSPQVITECNVVSAQVAAQMALGAKNRSGATMGVGVTGLAGPGGGDEQRPVGTVYIALAKGGYVWVEHLNLISSTREDVRERAAVKLLDMIRRAAADLPMPGEKWPQAQVHELGRKTEGEEKETMKQNESVLLRFFAEDRKNCEKAVEEFLQGDKVKMEFREKNDELLLCMTSRMNSTAAGRIMLHHCTEREMEACGGFYGENNTNLFEAMTQALLETDRIFVAADREMGEQLNECMEQVDKAGSVYDFGGYTWDNRGNSRRIGNVASEIAVPMAAAQARVTFACRLTGADWAVTCFHVEDGMTLVVGGERGCWRYNLQEGQRPVLWAVDIMRRAALGLPQAAGVLWIKTGTTPADMPLEPALLRKRRLKRIFGSLAVVAGIVLASWLAAGWVTGGSPEILWDLMR